MPAERAPPARVRAMSVGIKFASVTISVILVVTGGVYLKLSDYQRESLLQAKERSAAAVTKLFVDSCAPAVVFEDNQALVDVLKALAHNDEVEYAAVWGVAAKQVGSLLAKVQHEGTPAPSHLAAAPPDLPAAIRVTRETDRVVLSAPVHNVDGGVVGVATVAFSLARENRAIVDVERTILIVSSAVALGLAFLLMALARLVVVGPLAKLVVAAKRIEEGGSGEVDVRSKDEVGQLARAFRSMASAINVREERIRARNADMRLVLDTVDEGLLTVSLEGRLAERSAIVDRWFGPPASDADLFRYLHAVDPAFSDGLTMGFEALREDYVPEELILDQLPKYLCHKERDYACTYTPIRAGARLEGILVVIKDVTTEMAHARQEALGRERLALFNAIAGDRAAFLAFVDESNESLTHLSSTTLEMQRRVVHTLKGNAGMVSLGVLASICHQLEDQLVDATTPLDEQGCAPLLDHWRELTTEIRTLVGEKPRDLMELSRASLQQLVVEIDGGASTAHVRDRLSSLALESSERPLLRLGNYGYALARRLGKGDLLLEIEPGGVRLDVRQWEGLWYEMVHVVRNAVDHGIETTKAREHAGKVERPRLRLSTYLEEGRALVVEVEDNGGGVDWNAVRETAAHKGLPHQTEADLIDALFSDGISTKATIAETSGRGIGLSAVRQQVERRGGKTSVRSERGVGTTFTFRFPLLRIGASHGIEVGDTHHARHSDEPHHVATA